MTRTNLSPMTSLEQLHAGRTTRRLLQLALGLTVYGVSMAMMLRSGLGLDPWDVFHYGVAEHLPVSFGTVVIIVGAVVLLLWIPLRQWPGLGTIANVFVIGLATDAALAVIEAPEGLLARSALLLGGILLNGLAGAMYIGSQFGPGPRDGLMTGLVARTGGSIRVVRTAIEVAVLVVGWALGGVVGVGTVLYALLIGPVVQAFLPLLTVPLEAPAAADRKRSAASGATSAGFDLDGTDSDRRSSTEVSGVKGEDEGQHGWRAGLAQRLRRDRQRPSGVGDVVHEEHGAVQPAEC
jgi:uncharacterized membrane protein YczE